MVSLNAWGVLKACLDSLGHSAPGNEYEIVVVDNASSDGTPERLRTGFPNVRLICNDRNVGFTHANNQAIAASKGDFLLWLNTDTILSAGYNIRTGAFSGDASTGWYCWA